MTTQPYHHGNLRAVLVEQGLAMVEAGDAGALSLREVARRSRVSAAAVYRHFADRRALLAAIAAEGFAALNAAFEQALAALAGDDPLARLQALGVAYVEFALHHPGLYRLMFGGEVAPPTGDPRLAAEGGSAYRALEAAVAACCGSTASASMVTAAAVAAWSMVHGFAMLRLDGQLAGTPRDSLPDTGAVLANLIPKTWIVNDEK